MNTDDMYTPHDWLDREDTLLAPYAMRTRQSRGRRHQEPLHAYRSLYQRDRDRIVHCTAFRRLMYKTQVLVAQTNDHHRTRLTHTLEVAQISRTIARQLGLNEDLTEAIALAHDLGHPPFGHSGETALNACMHEHGGFNHNRHGMRIVDVLEYRYVDFPGLNLSWEVLESMALHTGDRAAVEVQPFLGVGQPLLEAQVVDAADSLAYDTHDIDDALSVGLIRVEDVAQIECCRRAGEAIRQRAPDVPADQFQQELVRALIDWQVEDLLTHTRALLAKNRIGTVADVRSASGPLVGFGSEVRRQRAELEGFLHRNVYRNYRVVRMATKGQRILKMLFEEYLRVPEQMPDRYQQRASATSLPRTVCDYLAGMTDRFAQDEFLRLFQPYTSV